MLKVYFDTNIFSAIAKQSTSVVISNLVSRADKDILFFYSQAHLDDLSNDITDNKFTELDTISNFVKDNYLYEDFLKKSVALKYVSPRQAYETLKGNTNSKDTPFKELFDLAKYSGDLDKNAEIDLGPEVEKHLLDNDNPHHRLIYNAVGIYKRKYKMDEWLSIIESMMERFSSDPDLIKFLRRESISKLKVEKLKLKIGEIKFDENLRNSLLGKDFEQLVNEQFEVMPDSYNTAFNRITTGFNLLNFFGFDYEKNKKVKYTNTINDGQHCYFAGNCDILVSNDVGLINKSKFIYSYYNIDTKVLNPEEFVQFISDMPSYSYQSEFALDSLLEFDRRNGIVLSPRAAKLNRDQVSEVRLISNPYWYYFNRLSEAETMDSKFLGFVLHSEYSRLSNFYIYKEIDYIIKNLNNLFNSDQSLFDNGDMNQINAEAWEGRNWRGDNFIYWLRFSFITEGFVIQIE